MILYFILSAFLIGLYFRTLKSYKISLSKIDLFLVSTFFIAVSASIITSINGDVVWVVPQNWQGVSKLLVMASLLILTRVDCARRIIPDRSHLLAFAALILQSADADFGGSITNLLWPWIFGLLMWGVVLVLDAVWQRLSGKYGMGGGDIKMLLWMAVLLQEKFPYAILGSCIFAGIWLVIRGTKKSKDPFAYGPFLALATLVLC